MSGSRKGKDLEERLDLYPGANDKRHKSGKQNRLRRPIPLNPGRVGDDRPGRRQGHPGDEQHTKQQRCRRPRRRPPVEQQVAADRHRPYQGGDGRSLKPPDRYPLRRKRSVHGYPSVRTNGTVAPTHRKTKMTQAIPRSRIGRQCRDFGRSPPATVRERWPNQGNWRSRKAARTVMKITMPRLNTIAIEFDHVFPSGGPAG